MPFKDESFLDRIPFGKPFIAGKELYYIAKAVEQGNLSGDQRFTKLCHRWLEENIGCKKALLTHSCTAALEMAAILVGVQDGDEVIMPSYTFVSTANAFVLRGAKPVFVDIRPDTLNINEALIRDAITEKTKAIVPVHYAGIMCDMSEIKKIADEYGLKVIEDAAQAIYSSQNGAPAGSIGDIGCLSFHETKNVISGEGGAILINDPELFLRAEIIREKGTNRSQFFSGKTDKYTWVDIGSSFLPGELIAAFLYAQLENSAQITAHRINCVRNYENLLSGMAAEGFFSMPGAKLSQHGNGHLFYILMKSASERSQLISHLEKRGIGSVFHYVPLHSSPAGKMYGRASGSMGVTDDVSSRLLRLPLFFDMEPTHQEKIADEIRSFFVR
jgi:dTDP-4-amino-4,6-dideoxygalactose transaminase